MAKNFVSKAIGIDLGTTNSVVAVMNPSDTEIVLHRDSKTQREITPSCVWKDPKSRQIVVGRQAYSRIGARPQPIRSIKRSMGGKETVLLTNENATPEEISAYILREMKRQIEEDVIQFATASTEWIVDRAIITVPAYFDQPQIDATRRAGEMAGLQVLELLHEPTAVACYHCWATNTQNGVFLVYDLGGGTFDVAIVRCIEGEFEVLGISGNNRLGGDDIDTLLAQTLQERLIRQNYALDLDLNNDEDKIIFDKLKFLAEGVKKALSTSDEFILRDTARIQDKAGEMVLLEETFERYELEQLIKDKIVERTIPYCFEALEKAEKKAGITLANIDAVILAGGSTHIPLVRETVRKYLCADPATHEPRAKCSEPVYKKADTIVGLGASIRAAATGGLSIYNPERTVRVSFRGVGSTDKKQIHIGGEVQVLTPGIELTGGRIQLTISDLNFEDEQDLKSNGTYAFTRVPLQPMATNVMTFKVYDQQGKEVARIERHIIQSRETLPPTGGSSGTAVNVKEIRLDVNHQGTVRQAILIHELSKLAVKEVHEFYHPGDTDNIRLPLYQKSKKIQELPIPTGWQPKGTKIKLTVEMDNLSSFTIKGMIGDSPIDLAVELPEERALPSDEEVQALNRAFQNAMVYLPGGKRAVIEAQYRRAKQGYEAAVKQKDQQQAIHEFEQMEELVTSISHSTGSLEPPKEKFDELVSTCHELNRYVKQSAYNLEQPYDYKEMTKTIEAQQIQGDRAFEARDQTSYSDAIEMLESIHDHLISLYQKAAKFIDRRTEAEKATDYLQFATQEASKLEQLAARSGSKEQLDKIRQIKQDLHLLEQSVSHNPQDAEFRINQTRRKLEQINNVLAGSQNQSDIKGLLEDWKDER